MIETMRTLSRVFSALFRRSIPLLMALLLPVVAFAQEERQIYDARLEGYGGGATLDLTSSALTYLMVFVLGIICMGVMFMNPKRSHLD
jgi:hypothetical protein